jgi:hypothetical protein
MGRQVNSAVPFGTEVAARYLEGLTPRGISAELIADKCRLTRGTRCHSAHHPPACSSRALDV